MDRHEHRSEESDGRGGKRIRTVLDDAVAGAMRTGSRTYGTMLAALGARPRPVRRGK